MKIIPFLEREVTLRDKRVRLVEFQFRDIGSTATLPSMEVSLEICKTGSYNVNQYGNLVTIE